MVIEVCVTASHAQHLLLPNRIRRRSRSRRRRRDWLPGAIKNKNKEEEEDKITARTIKVWARPFNASTAAAAEDDDDEDEGPSLALYMKARLLGHCSLCHCNDGDKKNSARKKAIAASSATAHDDTLCVHRSFRWFNAVFRWCIWLLICLPATGSFSSSFFCHIDGKSARVISRRFDRC